MEYFGIGFSNIRLPNSNTSYMYKYDSNINTFPEEVFVHEFLHSLERDLIESGYDIPHLHDNEKYGYKNKMLIGLKEWYRDYMQCRIKNDSTGKIIGLNKEVYTMKPVHNSNFRYSYDMTDEVFKEPSNLLEFAKQIFNNIGKKKN